jgi:hypothetical protein
MCNCKTVFIMTFLLVNPSTALILHILQTYSKILILRKEKDKGDQTIWVIIHIYLEMSQ